MDEAAKINGSAKDSRGDSVTSRGPTVQDLVGRYKAQNGAEDHLKFGLEQISEHAKSLNGSPIHEMARDLRKAAAGSLELPEILGLSTAANAAIRGIVSRAGFESLRSTIAGSYKVHDASKLFDSITTPFPELSMPQPAFDPILYRDHKLDVAIETRHAVEDVRDATLELATKHDAQIEHLQTVIKSLSVAHETAIGALEAERQWSEKERQEAEIERSVARRYNRSMLIIALVSVVVATASLVVSTLSISRSTPFRGQSSPASVSVPKTSLVEDNDTSKNRNPTTEHP